MGLGKTVTVFAKDCLEGKSLLITGGLGSLGRVVVKRLLDHSARVAVNDILSEEDARKVIQEDDGRPGACFMSAQTLQNRKAHWRLSRERLRRSGSWT